MTTAAHQLLDHLLDDLKKELFEKMHQNIVLELEKQKRNLQNMVVEMLTERKGEMLVVVMNKVHREIMKEQEKIMKESKEDPQRNNLKTLFESLFSCPQTAQ